MNKLILALVLSFGTLGLTTARPAEAADLVNYCTVINFGSGPQSLCTGEVEYSNFPCEDYFGGVTVGWNGTNGICSGGFFDQSTVAILD